VLSPEEVSGILNRSRVLLLPSRWETGPIVLGEALASGCTVVGTDRVPSILSTCGEGPYGQVSRPKASALATALGRELSAWSRGERHPWAVADYWRPRFDPVTVCRQLLNGHPHLPPS
jgi:glycosyltransferase involved in cell wall biosynthesis